MCACARAVKALAKTVRMLRRVRGTSALAERICRMNAHFVYVREQWRLWLDGTNAQARQSIDWWNMPHVWEQWRLWQDCMNTKSRLSIDWKNMPYVRPFCACARAVKALARLHACSGESEHWLMEYAVCMPILCMCKRSDGSGETARMLKLVWALTDKRCHVYTHCVYVREQWRL